MKWKVYAKDGNTCYRPNSDGSRLRGVFEEVLSSLEDETEMSLNEVLLTDSDDTGRNRLVVEDRTLSEWVKNMNYEHREFFKMEVRPALKSGRFEKLLKEDFLVDVTRYVLNDGVE